MFKVPVLFIIYNRIEETHNVFQILRTIQPTQLYVAGDGCKDNQQLDRLRTYQTRAVVQPEWPCQLHTHWEAEHYGKSQMIYKSLKWFFENEEEGIVLFEDTLPAYDFFPYCEELLNKYRNDERIYSIGGSYLRKRGRKRYKKRLRKGKSSYFFSAYATTWGFATWKKRWLDFSLSTDDYENEDFSKIVSPYMVKQKQKIYWVRRFNIMKKFSAPIWDYLYNLHIWAHNGLCISPYINLVTNVGFKKRNIRKYRRLQRESYPIMPITHPDTVVQNHKEDKYMFKHIFNKAFITLFRDWLKELIPKNN